MFLFAQYSEQSSRLVLILKKHLNLMIVRQYLKIKGGPSSLTGFIDAFIFNRLQKRVYYCNFCSNLFTFQHYVYDAVVFLFDL